MADLLPVSVVIVAKNEWHNLPRCLASVQGWVSEIVVALNDTTDDSEAVARSFGARVQTLPWQGYRDTKNAALALASQPWALALDADEEVSSELGGEIAAFFDRGDAARFSGARFPRKVRFLGRWITHGDWYPDYSLRLFRRDRARWGGNAYLHEKIDCSGEVATLRGDLLHYPYDTLAAQQRKMVTYAELFVQQGSAEGATISPPGILGRACWRFIRAYILKRGFLDGFPGLVAALVNAHYTFLRYASLYEARSVPPQKKS
ncbi:MAG TPA: glycosyltransferase family 2 protein [Opitutaceae bacterium]|nr:glycosyltransferase family 2 protein [Opitutaceae bacterium]